jgi:hypothetical protein
MTDAWQPIETAPKDGTLIILMVDADLDSEDSSNPTEDELSYRTIGHNNFDDDGRDVWQFAGWCWRHDHWVEGRGTPTHWQPMPARRRAECDHKWERLHAEYETCIKCDDTR